MVLLTEDRSGDARLTLERVVRHILLLLLGTGWQERRVVDGLSYVTPREKPPGESLIQRALNGQHWRSTNPRDRQAKLELARFLANLLRSAHTIIVFHLDGDCAWSQRPGPVLAVFEKFLEREVAHLVTNPPAAQQRGHAPPPPMTFDEARSKLVLVVPYYSIEAWLYRNRMVAEELCRRHYQGRGLTQLEAWAKEPHGIEEVLKPKEFCLHDKHNAELAADGFPAWDLYELDQSFTETVNRFVACTPLFTLLKANSAATP